MSKYHPESYWTEVGRRIRTREDGSSVIAGDDEPYYRYKRERFLELLDKIDFYGKSVLEIGCGPGGNLKVIWPKGPARLVGADISGEMVALAREGLPTEVDIVKVDGRRLPFADRSFDIVFTATVLQHNTDEAMLRALVEEIGRVSAWHVYLFERIEDRIKGDALCEGRPLAYYGSLMEKAGFEYVAHQFLDIRVSYYVCGAIRKLFNRAGRLEGEPQSGLSMALQRLLLPATIALDRVFRWQREVALLEFRRAVANNP